MSPLEVLEIATRGGANILGRPECGRLSVGKRTDIDIQDTANLESARSWDPAALLLAVPIHAKHLKVKGGHIVGEGQLLRIELPSLIEQQIRLAKAIGA